MGRNGEGESVARTSSSSSAINRHSHANTKNTVLRTRPDPFLIVCRCFSVITALTAVLCIAVNVFSAIRSFKDGSDIFDGIFRCYAVVIACFVVLAETEWKFVMKSCKVLEYWAARGMLQIFVAVMTRAFPDYTGVQKDLVLLESISSYMLLACGVVYLVSGLLCIGHLKRVRQQEAITRDQAVKDLEDLERRREELEQLLLVERVERV
ncbi:uncharacterized protein LOC111990491 [Quercus suber]|uniref:Golgi apparatus membrane protein TVP15 n=1 Tax=Quercus suber TaxID=58331 RepID=A0AAW0KJ74_QUESU|nr:uncharacterized protein LOC111990491 isoform X1 [Quercus suber]POE78919.1 hypothetical protein CFP56_31974 [Quercus suber]